MKDDKATLRRRAKDRIKQFDQSIQSKESREISNKINNIYHFLFLNFKLAKNFPRSFSDTLSKIKANVSSSSVLGMYAPLKDEPDCLSSLDQNASNLKHLSFPGPKNPDQSSSQQNMGFFRSKTSDLLLSDSFGTSILSPNTKTQEVVPLITFVPGLLFTKEGFRLGRGKGFYDRYLAQHPSMLKIGVCFSIQLEKSIPVNEYDQRMDFILTHDEIIDTRPLIKDS